MSNRVVIVNHGLCNLRSIARALEDCGADVTVTDDPQELRSANRVVLPGVGAFPAAMNVLKAHGLADALRELVQKGNVPVLGICLGMQLFAEHSDEGIGATGLGLLPGRVKRLSAGAGERIPHMGWNSVFPAGDVALFSGIPAGTDFYFVHSYHLDCPDRIVAARTQYCGEFVAAVASDLLFAVQFHPEKSQRAGLRLLRNFMEI